jgi:hypothetical protein
MGTTPLQKNGKDHAQDRDLRELRDAIDRQRAEDVVAHGEILTQVVALDKDLLVTHARDEEKALSEKSLRKQVFALALLSISMAAGLITWAAGEFRDLHQQVNDNSSHFKEFQAIGIRWGDDIDARDKAMQDDIRQLQVHDHSHNGAQPRSK